MSGEFFALATALCWTGTSMAFSEAGKRIGSLNLNLIRLITAFGYFLIFMIFTGEPLIPTQAPVSVWIYLSLSGLVGFVFGDLFLFRAFVLIGARLSMLIYASVPMITLFLGWVFLGETIGLEQFLGVVLTLGGIATVVLFRAPDPHEPDPTKVLQRRKDFLQGIGFGFLGALGQAGGLIIARFGTGTDFSAFGATQIRVIAGILGFGIIFLVTGRFPQFVQRIRNRQAMTLVALGAFLGPFLGVSLGLRAAQLTTAGIAATLMAISPVLIIPPSIILYKERITLLEVVGTFVTLGGVAVLL